MSIENPNFVGEVLPGKEPAKENNSRGLRNKFQKVVAVGALAATAFGAEGCKPTDNKGSSDQEFAKEALKVLENLNQEKEKRDAEILSSYYNNVGHPYAQVFLNHNSQAETTVRAWDIVKKKGFFKNGADGQVHMECKRIGLVPVEIKVNGQFVPVGSEDYTSEELGFVRTTDKSVESLDEDPSQHQNSVEKKIESKPNKPFISHQDDF